MCQRAIKKKKDRQPTAHRKYGKYVMYDVIADAHHETASNVGMVDIHAIKVKHFLL